ncbi:MAG: virulence RhuM family protein, partial [Bacteroidales bacterium]|nr:virulence RhuM family protein [Bacteroidales bacterium]
MSSIKNEASLQGELAIYHNDDTKIEVVLNDDTVWLSQSQIVLLFQSSKANISEHIKSIYQQNELDRDSTVRNFRTVRVEGNREVFRNITYYNLDVIISVGFRVNTKIGIHFRQWANNILKNNLLKGYSINQRIDYIENKFDNKLYNHDVQLKEINEQINYFVQKSMPPVQGVFYGGEIFEAYKFMTDLIKIANESIIVIDNYIDESVLTMLDKRKDGVVATICTDKISNQLKLDLERHNKQYSAIEIQTVKDIHDRFVIIDNEDVFHIGASLKDLGKKLFAFSKLNLPVDVLLKGLRTL